MTKIIFSTLTLLLLLQGCNSSSSTKNNDDGEISSTTVSADIKSFAKGLIDTQSAGSSIKGTSSSFSDDKENTEVKKKVQYQKQTLKSCSNGGTVKVTGDVDFESMTEAEISTILNTGFSMTIDYDNCIEDGEKINASMSMLVKVKNELMNLDMKFNKESTFEDLESTEILTVSKDSNMNIKEVSDEEEIITENLKFASSKGKSYETINLITHELFTETQDSFYEVSGKRIDNGLTYTVDKDYDASKTPMVLGNHEDLISGTAKYFNEKNEHITVKVIGKNKIKISVDSDNDGKDDAEEIIEL